MLFGDNYKDVLLANFIVWMNMWESKGKNVTTGHGDTLKWAGCKEVCKKKPRLFSDGIERSTFGP